MSSLGLTKEQRNMVLVLLSGAVLVVLNQTLLSPALPSIMSHLAVDATTVQWLTSAYALTEAIVIPLAAWFMGRFSTRTLFIGGMTLFGAGSLVAAVAPVFAVLLLGRIMQAMATGVMMVMVMALILLVFPRESRGKAMGLVSLVIGFAPAVGPSVGGLLVDMIGWRALFGVVVAFAAVVIVFAWRALENHEGFPRTSADALSVAFSSIGLATLLYGLSSFASSSQVGLCVVLMVVGVAFVALFVRRQFRLDEPMLRLEVLKSRRYRTAFVVCALLQAILIGLSVITPLYLQNVLGHSATISGVATLPGALLGAFAGLIGGRIFDKAGVRGVALGGGIALLAGGVGMFFYQADSALWFVIAANMVTCGSLQILFTPVNTWGVNSLDNRLVQHATAVTNTVNQVGGSLGTALIMSFSALGTSLAVTGSEVERVFAGYHLSYIVVLVLSALVLAIIIAFVRNKKSDEKAEDASPDRAARPQRAGAQAPAGAVAGGAGAASGAGASASGRETVAGSLHRSAAEVMDPAPATIPVDASMAEAARLLAAANASGAVLVDAEGNARGFVSNSDILRFFGDETQVVTGMTGFMVLRQLDNEDVRDRIGRLAGIPVLQVATKKVVGVAPDTSVEEACRVLAEKRLKELPVLDGATLLGVVRRSDLMRLIATVLEEDEKAVS